MLAQHPDVAAAVVFPVPHRTWGEDVAAAVVLRQDSGSSVLDVRRYVAARLVGVKVPGQLLIVETIPASSTGKIQRSTLAQFYSDRLREEFVAPRNFPELAWRNGKVLDISSISINDNFFAPGGYSIKAIQAINRISAIQVTVSSARFRRADDCRARRLSAGSSDSQ